MDEQDLLYLASLMFMHDDFGRILLQNELVFLELAKAFVQFELREKIEEYVVQKDIKMIKKRSYILDSLMRTTKRIINIKIENNPADLIHRIIAHILAIDWYYSKPGKNYRFKQQIIIIFYCSFNYFKQNQPFYELNLSEYFTGRILKEFPKVYIVNGKYKGSHPLASLIHDMQCANPNEIKNEVHP